MNSHWIVGLRPALRSGWFVLCAAALVAGCGQQEAKPTRSAEDATSAQALPPPPPQVPAAAKQPPATTGASGTFVDRHAQADLRLVSYNVLWNNIFVEVSPEGADKFVRVMRALNPDIVCLQEIGWRSYLEERQPERAWSAADVVHIMNAILPLGDGATWHAHHGNDNIIVSRWPLELTATDTKPPGDRRQAMALVDLPDASFGFDFYIMNNHYKCCGGTDNDPRRQKQSDAIAAWIRDARTPGDEIDLADGTAIAVVGDLNIVGGFQPVQTLLDGDIINEAAYGPDFPPDWDDSEMADLHPVHNTEGPDDYTWRNDNDEWDPGRLDYIIYTDSTLEVVRSFILNTTTMSDSDLAATGLQRYDVTVDQEGREFDHLPLVADFRIVGSS
jgi:endonuclease/exonuclease/phosphatase family metal-dependent hydrolase